MLLMLLFLHPEGATAKGILRSNIWVEARSHELRAAG